MALWTGASILAATAVILLVMKRSAAPLRRPTDGGARVEATLAHAAEATPARIRVRVSTSPSGAAATLQGQPIGRTPIDAWVPALAADGALTLDLPGYRATERTVPLDRDSDIRVSLDREPRRSRASSRRRKERRERERAREERRERREKREREREQGERDSDEQGDGSAADADLKGGR